MNPQQRLRTIERACADLIRDGKPVTFTAISSITGVSRSTLYRNTALRAVIDQYKYHTNSPLRAISDELATLRAAIDTLAKQVRSHDEELRRLRK